MTDACFPRSRDQYLAELTALDVGHRPEWQPKDGLTHCNQAARAGAVALGVEIPIALANAIQVWLDSAAGRAAGWEECTAARALTRAEGGYPTVATLHEAGHGHIGFVVPGPLGAGLHVWQAGARNFANEPIANGFGPKNLPYVRYFTHD